MSETQAPTSAIVPVKSSFMSKINWTQVVGVLAVFGSIFGLDITPEQQVAIVTTIALITQVATMIVRTWFTKDVTAASVATAPTVDQSKPVVAVTPPGEVVNATTE